MDRLLAEHLFSMIHGMTAPRWIGLLRQNRGSLSLARAPRLFFNTSMSLLNSLAAPFEERLHGKEVNGQEIEAPVFILGHWRSGTTHLHNLLACDPRFTTPTLFQTLYPQTFLVYQRFHHHFQGLVPTTRLIDNIQFGFDRPQEEEFALANSCGLSPYLGWIFPQRQSEFDRFLTLESMNEGERERWRRQLTTFLKKVAINRPGRLLCKSPTHTARIRHLLDLFPDASFVHISRDPVQVYQSTLHLHRVMWKTTSVESTKDIPLEEQVLKRYRTLYTAYLRDRELVESGRLISIRFEDLEVRPLRTLKKIYAQLNLGSFSSVSPRVESYLASLLTYQKNRYPPISDSERERVEQNWNPLYQIVSSTGR